MVAMYEKQSNIFIKNIYLLIFFLWMHISKFLTFSGQFEISTDTSH